jgi:hypothetical protein
VVVVRGGDSTGNKAQVTINKVTGIIVVSVGRHQEIFASSPSASSQTFVTNDSIPNCRRCKLHDLITTAASFTAIVSSFYKFITGR